MAGGLSGLSGLAFSGLIQEPDLSTPLLDDTGAQLLDSNNAGIED